MKSEKQKKKRGFFGTLFGVIGTVILTLLLAAIGLTAYLLISMKRDPVVTRTLKEYAQTEPDPSFEHLSFTEEGYMTQTYSEEDVGFFIAKYLDKEKIDPWSLLEEVPVSDLSLKGFDIRLENGGAVVCAEGAWRSIRLTARALLNIDADKGTIILSPEAVKLAGIRIPVSLIDRFFKTDIADHVSMILNGMRSFSYIDSSRVVPVMPYPVTAHSSPSTELIRVDFPTPELPITRTLPFVMSNDAPYARRNGPSAEKFLAEPVCAFQVFGENGLIHLTFVFRIKCGT